MEVIEQLIDKIKDKITTLDENLEISSGEEYNTTKEYKIFISDILELLKNINDEDDDTESECDESAIADELKENEFQESDVEEEDYE